MHDGNVQGFIGLSSIVDPRENLVNAFKRAKLIKCHCERLSSTQPVLDKKDIQLSVELL